MTRTTVPHGFDPDQVLTADHRAQLDAGEKALEDIRTMTIPRWLAAGAAWLTLQQQAMSLSNSQQPVGRRYADIYARLEQPWPHLTRIDKTSRMDAIWLFENQRLVLDWLNNPHKVSPLQRDTWLHPTTIRRHAREEGLDATRPPKIVPQGVEKAPTALQHANSQVTELRAGLDNAQVEIRQLKRNSDNVSEGRDWSWTDDAESIARVWLRLYPAKAPQIASKVLELNKTTAPRRVRRAKSIDG